MPINIDPSVASSRLFEIVISLIRLLFCAYYLSIIESFHYRDEYREGNIIERDLGVNGVTAVAADSK
ncbi:hypothetical protein PUN28_015372 [Cardiocondyla obscurior]|uniref:Uncharacterized protein n=1 Tax=Cardiocondyla obscurior TaxID=286306 RepID=A0AAW2EXN4_9HYME